MSAAPRTKRPGPLDTLRALRDRVDLDLHAHELLVLFALVLRANNDTGRCHPGHRRLAEDTRLSIATVKRTLRALAARGLVVVESRRDRYGSADTNDYRLCPTAEVSGSPVLGSCGAEGQVTLTPPRVSGSPGVGTDGPEGGVRLSDKLPSELPTGLHMGLDLASRDGRASPAAEDLRRVESAQQPNGSRPARDQPAAFSPDDFDDFDDHDELPTPEPKPESAITHPTLDDATASPAGGVGADLMRRAHARQSTRQRAEEIQNGHQEAAAAVT